MHSYHNSIYRLRVKESPVHRIHHRGLRSSTPSSGELADSQSTVQLLLRNGSQTHLNSRTQSRQSIAGEASVGSFKRQWATRLSQILSNVLEKTDVKAICHQEEILVLSLQGLGIGSVVACFHDFGTVELCNKC
ncbi:hypothetical protein TNCV_288981 [Trichonephila clavipes]|nr:hypothetical protein TNCV_288981 [Trichonephila clavipes]